jgi:hypothetical protein
MCSHILESAHFREDVPAFTSTHALVAIWSEIPFAQRSRMIVLSDPPAPLMLTSSEGLITAHEQIPGNLSRKAVSRFGPDGRHRRFA